MQHSMEPLLAIHRQAYNLQRLGRKRCPLYTVEENWVQRLSVFYRINVTMTHN